MVNWKKTRLCLEVIFLAAFIMLVWLVMFVPVTIFFLPLMVGEGTNGSYSIFGGATDTYECQLTNETDINTTSLECDDDFYRSGDLCLPRCDLWRTFGETAEIATLAIIGTATVIGIVTTIIIIILSFVSFRNMLKFPSVLILYQDIAVGTYGAVILIGFMDRRLFCVSDDLIESYLSSSHFCVFSGIMSSYAVLPMTIWITVQVGYILCAIFAPFYFNTLKEKKRTLVIIHIIALIVGILAPLVPSIASILSGGFTTFDTKFPPLLCFGRDRQITVYFLVIPLTVLMAIIMTMLILIIHLLIRNRCVRHNKNVTLQRAEVKMLIVSCCYVVVGIGAPLAYVVSSVFLRGLRTALSEYFECKFCGLEQCDRSRFEEFLNPPLITMGYSLLALYPVITLIYFVRFTALKKFITKYLPISSTGSSNSTQH